MDHSVDKRGWLAVFGHRSWPRILWLPCLAISGCGVTAGARPELRSNEADAAVRWLAPAAMDSVVTELLTPRVRLHTFVQPDAPWSATVLEVALGPCVAIEAAKGSETAVGRRTTSQLLNEAVRRTVSSGRNDRAGATPVAAINADFFIFTPAGVPTGAHVERGVLVSGPGDRPTIAVDSAGALFFGVLQLSGMARRGADSIQIQNWNRPSARSITVVDARWGQAVDTSVAGTVWKLAPLGKSRTRYRVARVYSREQLLQAPSTPASATDKSGTRIASPIALGDTLLLVRGQQSTRPLVVLREGDTLTVAHTLGPIRVRDAVGGFPELLRAGAVIEASMTAGSESFAGANPRTAVGVDGTRTRLWMAVIDGRQPGVSRGMTLRETTAFMQRLGATDALNLDGGGSSVMAVLRGAGENRRAAVVNRPSDATGERAVGNGLVLFDRCSVSAQS